MRPGTIDFSPLRFMFLMFFPHGYVVYSKPCPILIDVYTGWMLAEASSNCNVKDQRQTEMIPQNKLSVSGGTKDRAEFNELSVSWQQHDVVLIFSISILCNNFIKLADLR